MQTIRATYRVTTPMFLGGAEQQAELRLPSFKGALRFWWRALAWHRYRDVRQLREDELALFGSSDERVGQSKVLMRLVPCATARVISNPPQQLMDSNRVVGDGARYLGYGVMEAFASRNKGTKEGELTRPCILAPFTFTVELMFKPGTTQHLREQVEQALKALGVFGGLGSKSRKGYGSLTLTSLTVRQGEDETTEQWNPPNNPQECETVIRELLGPGQVRPGHASDSVFNDLPDWTAFSPAARVVVVRADSQDRTPLEFLDRIGREMVRYRSWGRNGKVLGREQREEIFKSDHDLMVIQRHPRNAHPERIVFGLPHNYGKKEHHKEVEPVSFDRRASPLFVHVHQASESDLPIAVLTLLPSRFLPEDQSKISVGGNPVDLNTAALWEPIENWLNRMKGETTTPHERKEPFGNALEVTHG